MEGLEFVRVYLDDLLILSGGNFESHLKCLEKVLLRLSTVNLRVHAEKCNFGTPEVEYLGYTISRKGVKPQTKKIQAILNLKPPSTVREVRRFLGIVQYYRDVWPRRSHTLKPLTDLISGENSKKSTKKIIWSAECQKSFDDIKDIISRKVVLAYPRFDQPFVVHTDASNY